MGFSITSNYAGAHAGQYIGAAMKSAASLDYLTILENVKYKRNITKVATSGLIVDATCDFTDAGSVTLTERVLEPKLLAINVDLCKDDLLLDWQADQMAGGASNSGMSSDFAAFITSHLSDTIADHVETYIWDGNGANPGQFSGINFQIDTDATVVQVDNTGGAATAHDATNIDNMLSDLTAAIPSAVYGKEDLHIYMGTTAYRLYLQNQAAAGYQQLYNMGDGFVPMYNGVKIAVCPGVVDNKMYAAQKSNMFFGTDLMGDTSELRILDMSELDGSSNIRVVAKFSAGIQHAQGGDVVRQD